jgi:phospholipase C
MFRFIAAAALAAPMLTIPLSYASGNPTKFSHIVIIFQENRTPDNLFHGLKRVLPAADIADYGINSKGEKIALQPVTLANAYDLGHGHGDFVAMYDNGKMDGADRVECLNGQGACPANPQFRYVDPADVAPYQTIAVNYGFANRMFQTNQGPSFPAHQFIFSGTSQLSPTSPLFAAENPTGFPPGTNDYAVGCVAAPNTRVDTIGPDRKENVRVYPCFEHATLSDLLDRPPHSPTHPISWRYYTESASDIWAAPTAIEHTCQPAGNPPRCTAPQWVNGNVVVWPAQILVDIGQGNLPAVSWVIPTGQDSDHANTNQGTGPSWVASIVNAIGQSPYWKDTVVFITWDDWGGWYDHVAPPVSKVFGYYELGFRVPLLVVSPYTPAGYVSQKQHDFGSILRFVETAFNLGRIPPGNFADARADDLLDFFDFSKPPRTFVAIPTRVPASHFLDRNRPMLPPDAD